MEQLSKYRYLDHIGFWVFIFLFIFDYQFWERTWGEALIATGAEVTTYMALVYINLFILVPKLLDRKRYFLFFTSLILLTTLYIITLRITGLEYQFYEGEGLRNAFSIVLNSTLFLLLSTLYHYFQKSNKQRQLNLQLKAEKANAELKYLKAQISPHFVFNTLNNIYALILQKHDNAAKMVTHLSKILRYAVYHSSRDMVDVSVETEHLQSYIDLYLLQEPISENIDLYQEGNFNGLKIAPLILISFLENAIKHGDINVSEEAWIRIVIRNEEGVFFYSVENSKSAHTSHDVEGIGAENIRSQLSLLYPSCHKLEIRNKDNEYKISLYIPTDKLNGL